MPYDKDGHYVSMQDAYNQWEPLAVALLVDTAKTYGGFVTYKQLTEFVQVETGTTHKGLITNWVGELLGRVIEHCLQEEIPQLSALCVTAEGTVGNGYRAAIAAERIPTENATDDQEHDETLDELDDHAAKTRLKCYSFFGAELPAGGGEPMLTPKAKAARDWKRAQAKPDKPPKLCPSCFVALPATGQCDNCD